ncbi:CLUMA_CG018853, isoform A [Clunio marinus]|uniref:CLUMA_CG018853, isoform A n=1 Tax=Clunio marinus TaxID=568069 RepID=A0A1J1J1K8_9DIPT|nr:CLUMA_CG018853, isoform A [Clunio marinus]
MENLLKVTLSQTSSEILKQIIENREKIILTEGTLGQLQSLINLSNENIDEVKQLLMGFNDHLSNIYSILSLLLQPASPDKRQKVNSVIYTIQQSQDTIKKRIDVTN